MTYALYTRAFGTNKPNAFVTITNSVTGAPATILASASGGVLNTNGKAKTDANGNLSVYIDTSQTWLFDVVEPQIPYQVPVFAKYDPYSTSTSPSLTGGPNGGAVGLTSNQISNVVTNTAGGRWAEDLGRRYDLSGRPTAQNQYMDILGDSTIWFPLQDGYQSENGVPGSLIVSDQSGIAYAGSSGQLNGTITPAQTPQTCWGFLPGLNFWQTGQYVPIINTVATPTQGQINGFNQSVKRICDLSTLATNGDMLLLWVVLSHPSTNSTGNIVSWGMRGDTLGQGGWAFGWQNSGRISFQVCPTGIGATYGQALATGDGIKGKQGDNTRSAIALEVVAGANPGWIEIRSYICTLGTEGPVTQTNWGVDWLNVLAGGVAGSTLPGPNPTSPLLIGSFFNTSTSVRVGNMPSGTAIANLGLQRRPQKAGIGMAIAKDLREMTSINYTQFPNHARY